VRRVFIGGLATDYCVLHTLRDAIKAGFQVVLLGDAVKAVNAQAGDGERAVTEMLQLGAEVVELEDLIDGG
jgi:nicotinamidase/pyrazinamidase